MNAEIRRSVAKYRSLISVGGFGLCLVATSHAQERWLSWSGPQECQNTEEVERQIQSLLGHNVDFSTLPATHVLVAWTKGQQWEFKVRVQLEEGLRERKVYSASCSEGFDVVALTLALLLDELEPTEDSLENLPPTRLSDEESLGEGTFDSDVSAGSSPAASSSETQPSAVSSSLGSPTVPPSGPTSAVPLTLGGTLRMDIGTFPRPLYGGGLQLGLHGNGWRSEVSGEYLLSGADGLPNSLSLVQYSLANAAVEACKHFPLSNRVDYSNCLGLQLGSLVIAEQDNLNRRASALWSSAQIGAGIGFYISPKWYNFVRLQLLFPLLRHQLLLEGGGIVHTLPAVSLQIQLGMSFDVTD